MALFPLPAPGTPLRYTTREARPWIERLARLGYLAKGVVYLTVGGLALLEAIGAGGRTTGSEGALRSLLGQPLGRVLLGAITVGLAGYALWRLVEAVTDPDHLGHDPKGLVRRGAYVVTALLHTGLALESGRLAVRGWSQSSGADGEDARHWTAMALQQPLGRWIVAAVGAGILIFGLGQLYRALRSDVARKLELAKMSPTARDWLVRLARLGLAARGIVFGVIGLFVIRAARQFDPTEARGVGGALSSLQTQPYGPWLLGGVAAGLVAYGAYQIAEAAYRRFRVG